MAAWLGEDPLGREDVLTAEDIPAGVARPRRLRLWVLDGSTLVYPARFAPAVREGLRAPDGDGPDQLADRLARGGG